ncbi:MAG: histidine phosphatase family protein [Candidatus Aenigmarchaeota archaeon]|nr:histidine phosphatase family protein [Candidatus Aenigmarchaeota archaeon]
MKVYFVRHGESNYNVLNLCGGEPGEYVHLTEKGRKQAEEAAEKLKNKRIDLIIRSEMYRTKQTAEIINKYHNAPMEIDPRINERKFGEFEKRPIVELRNFLENDRIKTKIPGGESFLDMKERVLNFLEDLKKRKAGTILVVSHDQVLRVVYGHFNNLSDEDACNTKVKNCEIYEFDI